MRITIRPMTMFSIPFLSRWWIGPLMCLSLLGFVEAAFAQPGTAIADEPARRSLLAMIQAGGIIGYLIIALSVVGVALVVDAFIQIREVRVAPPALAQQVFKLSQQGKFTEVESLASTHDSILGEIISSSLAEGHWGLDAVREAVQHIGDREITRLQQRVGTMGLVASIAPMLGLLGTVTGMIQSFDVLGQARGAARPDELAVGISAALVTTCMGLILAVPMTFFYLYFRDRVTRLGHAAAGHCDKMLRIMGVVVDNRRRQSTPAPPTSQASQASQSPQARPAPTAVPRPAQPQSIQGDP